MTRKYFIKIAAFLFALTMLAGCVAPIEENNPQTQAPSEPTAAINAPADPTPQAPADPITVAAWTCNTGDIGEYLTKCAAEFNASQDRYIVELTYAGAYAELLAKLVATNPGELPDIFHSDTEGAYTYFADSSLYVPIQKYVDEDTYDMSSMMSNLRATYTMDDAWQCMPLGNTDAGFFYNEDLLAQAGINPDTELNSYQDIVTACKKLKAIGVKMPFYMSVSSSFYTFPMTAQGIQYVDNNNGKDGIPTRSLISQGACHDATVDFFQFIIDMKAEGLLVPMGTTAADGRAMFANGECALMCGFISGFTTVRNEVNGKFKFGFHVSPTITAGTQNAGQCTGGGALFLGNNGDASKERGAWEFMKFLMADEYTSGYAVASGYLPTTEGGFNMDVYQEFVKNEFPSAINAYNAQKATAETCFNAWLPMFNDFHALCKEYYILAYEDASLSAEEITGKFAASVDECIELYRLSKGM